MAAAKHAAITTLQQEITAGDAAHDAAETAHTAHLASHQQVLDVVKRLKTHVGTGGNLNTVPTNLMETATYKELVKAAAAGGESNTEAGGESNNGAQWRQEPGNCWSGTFDAAGHFTSGAAAKAACEVDTSCKAFFTTYDHMFSIQRTCTAENEATGACKLDSSNCDTHMGGTTTFKPVAISFQPAATEIAAQEEKDLAAAATVAAPSKNLVNNQLKPLLDQLETDLNAGMTLATTQNTARGDTWISLKASKNTNIAGQQAVSVILLS